MKISAEKHIRCSGGILSKLLLGLVVLFMIGAVAWVLLLPRVVASQIHSKTGCAVTVDHLSVNPFTGNVSIKGMVIKNPEGWPLADFVDLREFKAAASVTSIFSNRLVADEVVIDMARFTVVKNQQGVVNATGIPGAFAGKDPAGQPKPQGAKKEFLIKHLVLKFDKLAYADYSGAKPVTKEYNLDINTELRDVDSVAKIIAPVTNASIGMLADILGGALNGRTSLLKDVGDALKGTGKKTGEKFKGLLDALDNKKP